MSKRQWVGPQGAITNEIRESWRRLLASRPKSELIDFIVETACSDGSFQRTFKSRFGVVRSSQELIEEAWIAIDAATDCEDCKLNSNFDYDSEAYQIVKQDFVLLTGMGKITDVMKLALKLMQDGSYQVECSDEGMMCEEIRDCLQVVITALKKSDLASSKLVAWCNQMIKADRVGFLCDKELKALRKAASSR